MTGFYSPVQIHVLCCKSLSDAPFSAFRQQVSEVHFLIFSTSCQKDAVPASSAPVQDSSPSRISASGILTPSDGVPSRVWNFPVLSLYVPVPQSAENTIFQTVLHPS